jgi:respiratory burst oxidase
MMRGPGPGPGPGGGGAATPGRPRWGSGATTPARSLSTGSSPRGSDRSSDDGEELVEVTLDLQEDDTIVLRSVEPAALASGASPSTAAAAHRWAAEPGAGPSRSRSPAIMRTSSHRLLQFSQELKAGAMSRAKQFSQDLTKRFTRTGSRANLVADPSSSSSAAAAGPSSGIESALAARAERRQRAQLDRTKSGAQRAIRGLRFISGNAKASNNAWIEVQRNFDRLQHDGRLSRDDFPECIGSRFHQISRQSFLPPKPFSLPLTP